MGKSEKTVSFDPMTKHFGGGGNCRTLTQALGSTAYKTPWSCLVYRCGETIHSVVHCFTGINRDTVKTDVDEYESTTTLHKFPIG